MSCTPGFTAIEDSIRLEISDLGSLSRVYVVKIKAW